MFRALHSDRSRFSPRSTLSRLLWLLLWLPTFASLRADSTDLPAEAFEVSHSSRKELPRGKEADGIVGDFVLRNRHIEALVSGGLPGRKANMGVDWNASTPGTLYDLSVRGSDNDQLTWWAPPLLLGRVSSVRLLDAARDGLADGEVGVVAERTVATGAGQGQRHRYTLTPDAPWLTVRSVYTNGGEGEWVLPTSPRWKEFTDKRRVGDIETGDSTNPPDHQGYAFLTTLPDGKLPPKEIRIAPGARAELLTRIAVGRSPAAAFGHLIGERGPTGRIEVRIEGAGEPVKDATLLVRFDEKTSLRAYPDASGRISLTLPAPADAAGAAAKKTGYDLVATSIGRGRLEKRVELEAGATLEETLTLSAQSGLRFEVTAAPDGRRTPCKVQFIGIGKTPTPLLGVDINAHGCRNQYHSEDGHFTQGLEPGEYRIIITHGIEFDHVLREVSVQPGRLTLLRESLNRIVDTSGWISTDFHNHSTPSGDNYCGTKDRVINLAAENIEFAPTTEHNRLYDWAPWIERLGLEEELATVPGIELTGKGAHLNAFPLKPDPALQDGGAPTWQTDPRINAIVLRDFQGGSPMRWVHLNHPQVGEFFRDRDKDGIADGGYAGLARLVDAAETWSLEILRHEPWYLRDEKRRENRTFAWLQLLNQGVRMPCIAVADAHKVVGNGVGGWRTYVRSSVDAPRDIDVAEIVRNAQAARMYVTNGPVLDVRLDDGTEVGGSAVLRGPVGLNVRVQATDWVGVNRVQVLVNGRPWSSLDFRESTHRKMFRGGVVRFDERIEVPIQEDAHLIVVAVGEGLDLERGWGQSWEADMFPCAFTNPIWIDHDGKGFQANGDNLGHDLPTAVDPNPPPAKDDESD